MDAANNRAIELLFGVAGGTSIAAGSGKNIADAMRSIVSEIERTGITSLDFTVSETSLKKIRDAIKKTVANIEVTMDGRGIGTTSSPVSGNQNQSGRAVSRELNVRAQEVQKLTKLYQEFYDLQLRSIRTKLPDFAETLNTEAAKVYDQIIAQQNTYDIQLEKTPSLYAKVEHWESQLASELRKRTLATAEAEAKQKALNEATLSSAAPLRSLSATVQAIMDTYAKLDAVQQTKINVPGDKLLQYRSEMDRLIASYNQMQDTGWQNVKAVDFKAVLADANQLRDTMTAYVKALTDSDKYLIRQENSYAKLANRAQDYYNRIHNSLRRDPSMDSSLSSMISRLRRSDFASVTEASKEFQNLQLQIRAAGLETETLGQTVTRVFKEKFGYGILATAALTTRRVLSDMYRNVVDIDTKLADLQVVSGATDNELADYFDRAAESAERVASSITDILDATAVYRRLGFGVQDSIDFAELTTMYSKIGDVAIEEAESNITSVIKAFGYASGEELSVAMDKMVKVANDYAISADELGEGLGNAASALTAAGNSFEESLAILTAAQTVTQNASKSSTAVRTITARLRQSTTDLEDLGEELDPSYSTKSSYRDKLKAITGVDILEEDQQTYKSTFQILKELAAVWNDLADIDQASVVGMVAGVRQTNVFGSLMSQWSEAEKVMVTAANAAGTMDKAYGIYIDSIEGRINTLTASFQKLSTNLVDDDVIKISVSAVNALVGAFDSLIEKVGLLGVSAGIGGIVALTKSVGALKTSIISASAAIAGMDSLDDRAKMIENISMALYQYSDAAVDAALSSSSITAKEREQTIQHIAQLRTQRTLLAALPEEYVKVVAAELTSDQKVRDSITKNILELQIEKGATKDVIAAKYEEILIKNGVEKVTAQETAARMANVSSMQQEMKLSNLLKGTWTNLVSFVKANPVAVGIGSAIAGIYIAYQISAKNFEKVQEAADKAAESWETLSKELTDNQKAVSSISGEYEKLSKGIGSNGENIGLTTDEFERYNTIANQIAEMFPQMVSGYTSQGNAILKYKGDVEQLNAALEEQQQLYYASIIQGSGSIFDEWNADNWAKKDETLKSQMYAQDYLKDVLAAAESGTPDDISDIFDKSRDSIGILGGLDAMEVLDEALGGQFRSLSSILTTGTEEERERAQQTFVTLIRASVAQGKAILDEETQNMVSIANAFLSTSFDFSKLSSETQSAIQQYVGQLDYTFFREFENQGQMQSWLETNLIAPLQNESNAASFGRALDFFMEKGIDIGSKDFADNFDIYADAIDTLRSGLDQGFSADFDWTAFYKGYESVQLLIDALVEMGYLEEPTSDAIYSITREMMDFSAQADIARATALSLTEALSAMTGRYDLMENAKEEVTEFGIIYADTISSILESFPELSGLIDEYIIGLASADDVIQGMQRSYAADEQNYKTLISEKYSTSKDYYRKLDILNTDFNNDLLDSMKTDLSNCKTLAEAKYKIEMSLLNSLSYEWSKYYDASAGVLTEQAKAIMNKIGPSYGLKGRTQEVEEVLGVVGKLQEAARAYKELAERTADVSWSAFSSSAKEAAEDAKDAASDAADEAEDAWEKFKEQMEDWFSDMEFKVDLQFNAGNIDGATELYRQMIAKANELLSQAYSSGMTIDDDWVQELISKVNTYKEALADLRIDEYDKLIEYNDSFDIWNKVGYSKLDTLKDKLVAINDEYLQGNYSYQTWYENFISTAEEIYSIQKDALEELLDTVMDGIRNANDEQIEQLEEQKSAYQDLIDLKKKLLEDTRDEADYEREVTNRVKEIAKLQERITQLELDDSREAQAERIALEEELAEKQQELADYQADYATDATIDALDDQSDAYSSAMDEQIDAVRKQVEDEVNLREEAIRKIDAEYEQMMENVKGYFESLGITIDEELLQKLTQGLDLVSQFGSYNDAVDGIGDNAGISAPGNEAFASQQIPALVEQMKRNSEAWHTANSSGNLAERERLVQENERIAQFLKTTFGLDIYKDSAQGVWYIRTAQGIQRLFDVYHNGGVVGGKQTVANNELMALLEKGEIVLNNEQQISLLDRIKEMSTAVSRIVADTARSMVSVIPNFGALSQVGGSTYAPVINVEIQHNGSMSDEDAKRYGDTIGERALDTLWKAMNQRGIT